MQTADNKRVKVWEKGGRGVGVCFTFKVCSALLLSILGAKLCHGS